MADDDQVLTEVTEAEEAAAAEPAAEVTEDPPVVEEVTEVAGEPVAEPVVDDAA